MSQPRVSVIVVSHGRPDLLCRAALSVFHQNHRPVELIRPPFCSILAIQFRFPRYTRPKLRMSAPRPIGATMSVLDLGLGPRPLGFLRRLSITCAVSLGQNLPAIFRKVPHLAMCATRAPAP